MTFDIGAPQHGTVSDTSDLNFIGGGSSDAPVPKLTVSDIVNARRVIEGPTDKLRATSSSKYPWVRPLWAKMRGNRWEVEQVSMVRDKLEFTKLSEAQQMAIRRALAFLSNLDAIQTENLSDNIMGIVTDPDIKKLLARQTFEEYVHVDMYSAIVETLFDDPMVVYDMYRHVPQLSDKNDYITEQGNVVSSVPTSANKAKALVSNIALEGIYFFSGFLTIYAVNRATGWLNGVVDGIKYIQRDELTHLEIFSNSFNTLKVERPELMTPSFLDECKGILNDSAKHEINWFKYTVGDGMPGATIEQGTDFIWHRAEKCANSIGLSINAKYARQPIPWFDAISAINGVQTNFFEGKPINYTENKPTFSRTRRTA